MSRQLMSSKTMIHDSFHPLMECDAKRTMCSTKMGYECLKCRRCFTWHRHSELEHPYEIFITCINRFQTLLTCNRESMSPWNRLAASPFRHIESTLHDALKAFLQHWLLNLVIRCQGTSDTSLAWSYGKCGPVGLSISYWIHRCHRRYPDWISNSSSCGGISFTEVKNRPAAPGKIQPA